MDAEAEESIAPAGSLASSLSASMVSTASTASRVSPRQPGMSTTRPQRTRESSLFPFCRGHSVIQFFLHTQVSIPAAASRGRTSAVTHSHPVLPILCDALLCPPLLRQRRPFDLHPSTIVQRFACWDKLSLSSFRFTFMIAISKQSVLPVFVTISHSTSIRSPDRTSVLVFGITTVMQLSLMANQVSHITSTLHHPQAPIRHPCMSHYLH